METPKCSGLRPRHIPTPKMSERRKSLFATRSVITPDVINEDSDLGPMSPLAFSCSSKSESDSEENATPMRMCARTSFKNILSDINRSSPANSSIREETTVPETPYYTDSMLQNVGQFQTPSEQMTKIAEHPKISFRKSYLSEHNNTPGTDEKSPAKAQLKWPQKRQLSLSEHEVSDENPKVKIQKLDSKARTSLTFDGFISTTSFYAQNKENEGDEKLAVRQNYWQRNWVSPNQLSLNSNRRRSQPRKSRMGGTINKGVRHKIHKPRSNKANKCLLSEQRSKLAALSLKILKKSILTKEKTKEEDQLTKLSLAQVRRANNILRNMVNPIDLALPLSFEVERESPPQNAPVVDEFQMEDEFADDDNASDILPHRKFFKSGAERKNRYKLKAHVFATIKDGKVQLTTPAIRKPQKDFADEEMNLNEEHREVDDIIKKLSSQFSANDEEEEDPNQNEENSSISEDTIAKFRARIPYKTEDPVEIQRQHNLLDFLVFNNILTEENFKIFIMEPNNFTEEANRIVNQFIVLTEPVEAMLPTEATVITAPVSPTSQISNMTSELALDCPDTQTPIIPKPANFPVFEKGYRANGFSTMPSHGKTKKIWRPIGSDQYQIDAGQKSYGAKMCSECGLLYSANEPEEEILHLNFHNSFHVLKFRGWKDEWVVTEISEWGIGGRIILVDCNHSKRKWDRVREIMNIVDGELGFPDIGVDTKSVVYLAIARNTIIGVCVAQHRMEAHRMIPNETIDMCTKEAFPVKCGISKIWVAAPYRRQKVARYLINCVRANFFFGHYLSFDEIAFSSPTQDGKALATQLANRPDFLVFF